MTSRVLTPTHLSLFALERQSGRPITRMPVYAEVGVAVAAPVELPPGNIDQRFDDAILSAIREVDPQSFGDVAARSRVDEAMRQAFSRLLTRAARDKLLQEDAAKILAKILREALDIAHEHTFANDDPQSLLRYIRDAIRSFAQANQLALVEQPTPDVMLVWAHPLGILATDHVGYLSFDLSRLPTDVYDAVLKSIDARRRDPHVASDVSIWLYPMARDPARIDALAQGRFAQDAVLVKLEMDQPPLPEVIKNLGLPAMQNPSLTDWRLSGASFAANPAGLLGEGGCENILPANLALEDFHFYQVVRLTDAQNQLPDAVRGKVRPGLINDYHTSWYPLGHSLGQILYSLPLAPGESVNLAVVDWTRRDKSQRTEDTKVTEQLVHNEHRDRSISETVNAALQEWQHGSSFMGGVASSAGIGAALSSGVGVAAGLAGSLGGSTATSEGTRNLTANTVQKVSDNITQASSAARELQSTVVVHSTQEEKEAIETRTVVNYNHSHALTILYYEVLRHFRVVTELSRRRPALLVHYDLQPFFVTVDLPHGLKQRVYTDMLRNNRSLIRANLLDQKYAAGLDALDRIEQRDKSAKHAPAPPPPPGSPVFRFFNVDLKTGGLFADRNQDSGARVHVRATLLPRGIALNSGNELWNPGAFGQGDTNNSVTASLPVPPATIAWSDIDSIQFLIHLNKTWVSFQHIKVTAVDVNDVEFVLIDKDYRTEGFVGDFVISDSTDFVLPTRRPPLPPPAPPAGPSADEVSDLAALDELLEHLDRYKEYYNRVVWLNEDPIARAARFDAIAWDGTSTLLDHIENRAVEIIGQWVAFPTADRKLDDFIQSLAQGDLRNLEEPIPILDERLVTLPTRGVFAEAKLGHCNASEEIDNTRFWDWQQSPIPHFAPEIAPTQTVTPQSQQQNLQPTPFPQSLVNIVNPPAAPDPTGLAAALNVLATPNIFRDMSGRAEVADLLKKLSDNTIGIAQAANQARAIQSKYGNAASPTLSGVSGGGGFGPRATPTQPSAATRDLGDYRTELKQGVKDGMISPEKANAAYSGAATSIPGQALLGFSMSDAGTSGGSTGPVIGWPDSGIPPGITKYVAVTPPSASWNSAPVQIFPIYREPIAGLTTALADTAPRDADTGKTNESPVQRCVALVPFYLDAVEKSVDVLVHFHGYNIGFRQAAIKEWVDVNAVFDVDLDQWESQLGNWGFVEVTPGEKRGRHLMAVLAQGNDRSVFGSPPANTINDLDAYLREVFTALPKPSLLPEGATPGRIVLTAHSGGGYPLIQLLSTRTPSTLGMVVILEAINGPGELTQWTTWVTQQLQRDLDNVKGKSEPDQMDYLNKSLRFFGFHTGSAEYPARYKTLESSIANWFTNHAKKTVVSSTVRTKWVNNYVIESIGGTHASMVGDDSTVLKMRPIEYALLQWQPK